jgi:hypothetical protein
LLVIHDSKAIIEGPIPGWEINKLTFLFIPEKEEGHTKVSWAADNGSINFEFRGFKNSLGSSINPQKIGTSSNGENFGFTFFHHSAQNINRVDFVLLAGGQYA